MDSTKLTNDIGKMFKHVRCKHFNLKEKAIIFLILFISSMFAIYNVLSKVNRLDKKCIEKV